MGLFSGKKKKVEEDPKLYEEAYLLGFEVGYYKHNENVGWVQGSHDKLMNKVASNNQITLSRYYDRGKHDGQKKRDDDYIKTLSKSDTQRKTEQTDVSIKPGGSSDTAKAPSSIEKPSNTDRPTIVNRFKGIDGSSQHKFPAMFKLFGRSK